MPSNVVHYYFAEEVRKRLNDNIVKLIDDNREAYNLGAQGPDVLFYLKFKGEPKLLGERIHKAADVFPMFLQSASYAAEQASDNLTAFLLGQLCHYASDRVIHPYVYFLEKVLPAYYPPDAQKHIHVLIESAFDYLCIKDYIKQSTLRYSSADKVKVGNMARKVIARYYSELAAPLFDTVLPEPLAEKAIKRMRLFFKLCDDPTGIVHGLIRLVERLIGAPKCISLFVRPRKERVEEDWFNHKRTPFPKYHNQSVMTQETFEELIERAVIDAVKLVDNFYGSIIGKTPLDGSLYKLNYSG